MRSSIRALAPLLCAVLALAACQKEIEPPFVRGVCFHAVPLKNGQFRFNQVSVNQPNIEHCAASLEAMRQRFLGLGGSTQELMGAYQGSWIFVERQGIFISQSLHGIKYLALVRTGDGYLAQPGAMPNE
ncbi:MAG TPA: hypothetical protein VHY32_05895 [Caulobacteraceae bacterium]|jgi:hypothetical protein|nr:hypothetical protein [Caulobacteraceae bacterium]